ncbi:MAG: beta-galactosidase, partial [Polymorphobacter sp.]
MKLGVCYYPEHWPEAWWDDDARAMVAMGLSVVRIGEFAWSRIEPEPGAFDWGWLDRALDTLHRHGLQVVLGTPTATPPKWLVDADPSMLAVDAQGKVRGFGSRRHYCFSSESYRDQCARIVQALAARYGNHPAVIGWQTDNEYGCHATTLSYCANALRRFRLWLAARYGDIAALNTAWGNVFWSQEYRSFDAIDAPNLTVTEANPAHRLDYQRFASDEVVSFNRLQVDILRAASPGRDIIHNFMGFVTDFDHHDVGADLDVASWDSYPLGFTEQFWFDDACKTRYMRQGHPDIAAFHHDLYRGVGRGRWWVMEQQPGPVNWARSNPAPLPGMVRAWTWEAFAHGAEVVSYFRWRQVPFGQEAMHAGLTLPDRSIDAGGAEARQVASEITRLGSLPAAARADVALVFGYASVWMTEIQPQGRELSGLRAAFEMYSALRQLGLNIDIVPPDADLAGYRLIAVPMLLDADAGLAARLAASGAQLLIGPRSGSKT